MAFPVHRTDYRRSGENIMRTFLIAFTAIVLLAGYAVQPPEKTVSYKVTLRSGERGRLHAFYLRYVSRIYFDRDAEVKVNPKTETSPFYIYENGELAGIIAPIRQR